MANNCTNEVTEEDEAVLIRQYKKLLLELDHHEEELKQPGNQHVVGYMKDAQQLFAQIKSPHPACLDAKVTKKVSSIVKEQGHRVSSNILNYNVEDYSARILQKLNVEPGAKMKPGSLVKFGENLSSKFRRSPALTYLYGAVPSQPAETAKEKPARMMRVPMSVLRETRTLNINQDRNNNLGTGQLEGTEEMVSQAFKCLVHHFKESGRRPLDFFRFTVDPNSFSKTIENFFHVSFLVKEGRAAVQKFGGLPVIFPIRQCPEEHEEEENDVVSNQVVIIITMKEWKVFAKIYRGQLPMIT